MSDLNEKELCELEDRHWAFMNPDNEHFHNSELPEYAAFEIRKLRQRIAALEAALEPFAYARNHSGSEIAVADFDRARAALVKIEEKSE